MWPASRRWLSEVFTGPRAKERQSGRRGEADRSTAGMRAVWDSCSAVATVCTVERLVAMLDGAV